MLRFYGDYRFYNGKKNTHQFIDKSPYMVGRSATADFELSDQALEVSKTHFSIFSKPDGLLIECISPNWLAVNGQQMLQGDKKLLTEPAFITLAKNVHLAYEPRREDSVEHSRLIETVAVLPKKVAEDESSNFKKPRLQSNVQTLKLNQQVLQLEQEIKATTSLHNNEITRGRVETAEAVRLANNLKRQLFVAEASCVALSVLNDDELLQPRAETEAVRRELDTLTDEAKVLQQHLSATEIQLHDAKKLNETISQELRVALNFHKEEMEKVRAGTSYELAMVAEEIKVLQQHLSATETQLHNAKRLNETVHHELSVALNLHKEEMEKVRVVTSIELTKVAEEKNVLQQHLSATEIQLQDAKKLNETISQELSAALDLHKEEIEKVRAGTSIELTKVAGERKNLQVQLSAKEREVDEAEKRIEDLHLDLLSQRDVAMKKEADNQRLRAEVNTAKLETFAFQASLTARETENKNLETQINSVEATFSTLSDDVARYKLSWEDSERKSVASEQSNAKLKNELDAAKLQLEKRTATLTKELNAAKETACANQIAEFEEFIETDLQCAICFELVIAATALNCGHTFCSNCVCDWEARSPNCPTCRMKITIMQKCKMLDSFIARAAGKLSDDFRQRRSEATGDRGTNSQGQPQQVPLREQQINFDLPGPAHIQEAQFIDLT